MEDQILDELLLVQALDSLTDRDQLYVVAAYYWGGVTQAQIADELSALRGRPYDRDRVQRIHRTAVDRMRRALTAGAAA